MRRLPLIFLVAIAAAACSDDKPVGMADIDVEHTPTMLTRNVETLISDSGITRFRITAPVWYIYDETATPVWRFPESLLLERFGDHMDVEATVRADSATYFKERQLWRLDGTSESVTPPARSFSPISFSGIRSSTRCIPTLLSTSSGSTRPSKATDSHPTNN